MSQLQMDYNLLLTAIFGCLLVTVRGELKLWFSMFLIAYSQSFIQDFELRGWGGETGW